MTQNANGDVGSAVVDRPRGLPGRFGVSRYCGDTFDTDILLPLLSELRQGADEQAVAMGAR